MSFIAKSENLRSNSPDPRSSLSLLPILVFSWCLTPWLATYGKRSVSDWWVRENLHPCLALRWKPWHILFTYCRPSLPAIPKQTWHKPLDTHHSICQEDSPPSKELLILTESPSCTEAYATCSLTMIKERSSSLAPGSRMYLLRWLMTCKQKQAK